MKRAIRLVPCLLAFHALAIGRGVSPYLPLNLEPEMELRIERVLLLADKPILKRPIAAATVLDALPKACEVDERLCGEVRRYLGRYMYPTGIGHMSLQGAGSSGSDSSLPGRHGLQSDSAWLASAQLYWQPSDHLLLSLGGVAHEDDATPTGSMLSIGSSYAQLDMGFRDHWLSPMSDSSLLIGTQAPTLPSVTLSNYTPMTRLGLHYEAFLARMEHTDTIVFQNGFTSGRPRLAGLHISIEPVSGWALGLNRLMQFGGGARGGNSFSDLIDAFFRPSEFDNTGPDLGQDEQVGNQVAAITSRFIFPGRVPFAIYFEYGGEDTSRGRNYLLGNSALSAGIHFPRVWRGLDFTYEISEWQNGWYVNSLYGEGLTNDEHVLGHWGADRRLFGDDVGGQSHSFRLGWEPDFGGALELRYRTLANESYGVGEYERAHDLSVSYSRMLRGFVVGAEAYAGQDVFGEDFTRFAAFLRYFEGGGGLGSLARTMREGLGIDGETGEIFVEAGVNANEVKVDLDDAFPRTTTDLEWASHFALGARRAISDRSDLGARLELDDINGSLLLAVRAIDYRYRFAGPLALGAFIGAARYDLATPAYGFYFGLGAQWRNVLPGWEVGIDLRQAAKVARDDLVASDPFGGRNDSFYDISSASLYLTRRF